MLVTVYAPPDVYALELAAIFDVLACVRQHASPAVPNYVVRLVANTPAPLATRSGMTLLPAAGIAASDEPAQLLIVASSGSWKTPPAAEVVAWLKRHAAAATRFGSIGNGAFLLGAAGLLDGRRVTTHWECSAELRAAFPLARLEPDRIFVRDGPLFSSAGGAAAADLMLSLVEEDHGRELALAIARRLVLFMKRSGAQAQLSVQLATQSATRDPIQRVQQHVRDHMEADLSVTALAALAAMSPRNFARVFQQEAGMRPTDFVEQTRVNQAKRMLEESALPPQQIARLVGFSSTEAARRAFQRRAGTTMSRYRARLAATRDG
ncbi:GlxA family transcriptional regulator [Sphingomonas profundi]|uniref:GlxA family transcriptional regulator n=1 Tax=Alterirhizorhabdus profundi TaxID=2681549 RepID=UPI0012E6F92E|nr:helix-turn-helix domain-containing protein [Sphingomonas profundi]